MANNNRSLFIPVPALPPVRPGITQAVRNSQRMSNNPLTQGKPMLRHAGKVAEAWSKLPPEARQGIKSEIINRASGKFTTTVNSPSSDHSSGYALSKTPNPAVTLLDTGVKANTFTSDYLDAKENTCSPLHISCAQVKIPDTTASKLFDYFNKDISFDLQTNLQANLSYNVNITTEFTAANILTTLNAVLYALQIYYYYTSIITYHSNKSNNNEGMIYLRSQITAQAIEDLTRLGRRLADTPFPPNMLELVRYLSTNYYSSTNQGSPMIKLCPHSANSFMVSLTEISTALTNMTTPTVTSVLTTMRKAVPHWKIDELRDVPIDPVYDANFQSIFANLPFSYDNGTTAVNVPTVANSDTTIAYNSYTNTLDGMAFALTTVYDSSTSGFNPGLITLPPPGGVSTRSTRKSYYEVAGVKSFVNPKSHPFLLRARQETYTLDDAGTSVVSLHLFGADRCLNVNVNSITETAQISLDYLMSWNTVAANPVIIDYGQQNKFAPKIRKDSASMKRRRK